jgi:hypothetical protein
LLRPATDIEINQRVKWMEQTKSKFPQNLAAKFDEAIAHLKANGMQVMRNV